MCKMEGMKFVLATEDNSDYKYYIGMVKSNAYNHGYYIQFSYYVSFL